jgi:hypothetical protein
MRGGGEERSTAGGERKKQAAPRATDSTSGAREAGDKKLLAMPGSKRLGASLAVGRGEGNKIIRACPWPKGGVLGLVDVVSDGGGESLGLWRGLLSKVGCFADE